MDSLIRIFGYKLPAKVRYSLGISGKNLDDELTQEEEILLYLVVYIIINLLMFFFIPLDVFLYWMAFNVIVGFILRNIFSTALPKNNNARYKKAEDGDNHSTFFEGKFLETFKNESQRPVEMPRKRQTKLNESIEVKSEKSYLKKSPEKPNESPFESKGTYVSEVVNERPFNGNKEVQPASKNSQVPRFKEMDQLSAISEVMTEAEREEMLESPLKTAMKMIEKQPIRMRNEVIIKEEKFVEIQKDKKPSPVKVMKIEEPSQEEIGLRERGILREKSRSPFRKSDENISKNSEKVSETKPTLQEIRFKQLRDAASKVDVEKDEQEDRVTRLLLPLHPLNPTEEALSEIEANNKTMQKSASNSAENVRVEKRGKKIAFDEEPENELETNNVPKPEETNEGNIPLKDFLPPQIRNFKPVVKPEAEGDFIQNTFVKPSNKTEDIPAKPQFIEPLANINFMHKEEKFSEGGYPFMKMLSSMGGLNQVPVEVGNSEQREKSNPPLTQEEEIIRERKKINIMPPRFFSNQSKAFSEEGPSLFGMASFKQETVFQASVDKEKENIKTNSLFKEDLTQERSLPQKLRNMEDSNQGFERRDKSNPPLRQEDGSGREIKKISMQPPRLFSSQQKVSSEEAPSFNNNDGSFLKEKDIREEEKQTGDVIDRNRGHKSLFKRTHSEANEIFSNIGNMFFQKMEQSRAMAANEVDEDSSIVEGSTAITEQFPASSKQEGTIQEQSIYKEKENIKDSPTKEEIKEIVTRKEDEDERSVQSESMFPGNVQKNKNDSSPLMVGRTLGGLSSNRLGNSFRLSQNSRMNKGVENNSDKSKSPIRQINQTLNKKAQNLLGQFTDAE